MAEIKFTGNKTIKGLKNEFKKAFGATLRVYTTLKSTQEVKDESATLASLRAEGKKGGDLAVAGNMQVGNFEKKVEELYGIKVQVAKPDNSGLSNNDITLSAAGKE